MARQYSRAQYRLLSAKSRRRRTVDAISLEPVVAVGNDLRVAAATDEVRGVVVADHAIADLKHCAEVGRLEIDSALITEDFAVLDVDRLGDEHLDTVGRV